MLSIARIIDQNYVIAGYDKISFTWIIVNVGKSDATDLNSLDASDFLTVRPVIRESRTLRRIRSIDLYHADLAERLTVSLDESSPIVLDLQLNR
jgi:hypothetical protein